MTEQEEANLTSAVRGALAEITMGVNTDDSGNGIYRGPCRSEVAALRAEWLALQQDRACLHRQRDCEFCKIIRGEARGSIVQEWNDAIAILPLKPLARAKGHVLVLPRVHVDDFAENPRITAATFLRAAELAASRGEGMDMNLITSKGPAATQTIYHFHVHLVLRSENDGLSLPWSR